MSEKVVINTENPITAHVAESKKTSNVAIVIAHDLFGVDQDIQERMDYWSAMGYTVVVPDLFSNQEGLSALAAEAVDNADQYRTLADAFNVEMGLQDVLAAIGFARGRGCHGVGVLGFGLGGLLAWQAAAKGDSEVSVSYCGVDIDNHLDVADTIETPVSLYMAEEDELVEGPVRESIREILAQHPQVRVFTHPYVRRGFYRWDSRQRDRCALTLAEHRAGEFFYMNLTLKHWQTRPKEEASA